MLETLNKKKKKRRTMPRYVRRTDDVQGVQLNWENWPEIQTFLDMANNTDITMFEVSETEVSDTCGEPGPLYLSFIIRRPNGYERLFRHGDYIIRGQTARGFVPCPPWLFPILFIPAPAP